MNLIYFEPYKGTDEVPQSYFHTTNTLLSLRYTEILRKGNPIKNTWKTEIT